MRCYLLCILTVVGLMCASTHAQKPAWQPPLSTTTVNVWPGRAPGVPDNSNPEVDTTTPKDNLIAGQPLIRLGNVTSPTLTIYKPKGKNTGAAMVVFPGGAYRILAIDLEGTEVCDWLSGKGITCVLLKYGVPDSGPYPKSSAALQDAQRALGVVRWHASEWHIDPQRIGVLGFSAGAHLAAALSTHYDKRLYDAMDAADEQNCRPDFAVVVYPGYLALAEQNFANNRDITVTDKTPPSFIVMAEDDPVHVETPRLFPDAKKRKSPGRAAYLFARRPRLRPSPHHSTRYDVAAKRRNLVAHHQCDPLLVAGIPMGPIGSALKGQGRRKTSIRMPQSCPRSVVFRSHHIFR